MGRACSTQGGMRTAYWLECMKSRDYSEDLGLDAK